MDTNADREANEGAMKCNVRAKGQPSAQFFLSGGTAMHEAANAAPCRRGQSCLTAQRAGGCLLAVAITPVLEAFSPIVSHERVRLTLQQDGQRTEVEETGQWAAFRLLIAAMRDSGCPFFGRSLPAGAGLASKDDGATTFRRMVRALNFPWREGAGSEQLARCGRDIESHLHPILTAARQHCRQDAAINAVILMFNCTQLAVEAGAKPESTAA